MEEEVKNWLARYFETKDSEIEKMIKSDSATSFLMIWSLFESKCFNGTFTVRKIEPFATDQKKNYTKLSVEEPVRYFYDRYQDKEKFRQLIFKGNANIYKKTLEMSYESISIEDKLSFIIFVVSRYRNNIFHGNKGLQSWLKYDEQIKKCIMVMISILDVCNATIESKGV
jgi:hypothetical protein